jgi:hypothetical protein
MYNWRHRSRAWQSTSSPLHTCCQHSGGVGVVDSCYLDSQRAALTTAESPWCAQSPTTCCVTMVPITNPVARSMGVPGCLYLTAHNIIHCRERKSQNKQLNLTADKYEFEHLVANFSRVYQEYNRRHPGHYGAYIFQCRIKSENTGEILQVQHRHE